MNGSKTNLMNREQILDAMKTPPSDGYYVWDGVNEDDRPATMEELRAGIALSRSRGRPVGSDKTQIALRVDKCVLEAFRSTGKGWQTRMNEALKEWLKEHAV
ncbi:BrnA antitoxin family protein [Methylobacter sp. S3L5C]|uniref:BrnA antitoxin family protein n=1 Tax=Methylobacter sp. S3L5C TaxID=2839024 RepID=UPI001FABCEFD|nr:BrnA antitoxin family protein [Methylobacter sp. S3L5C]UOA08591.1 BrnA antitoxin family protein [Methylobacter sp. S3L5C]